MGVGGLFLFEFFYFVVLSFRFTLQSALADKLTVLSGEWVPFSLKKRFEQRVLKRLLITAGGGGARGREKVGLGNTELNISSIKFAYETRNY